MLFLLLAARAVRWWPAVDMLGTLLRRPREAPPVGHKGRRLLALRLHRVLLREPFRRRCVMWTRLLIALCQ